MFKFLNYRLSSVVLTIILVISIFTLFFVAGLSYKQIQTLSETEKSVIKSYKIYIELERINSHVREAENGNQGFIISQDSVFLNPYNEAIGRVNDSFIKLKLLTTDNPEQNRRIDSLRYLYSQRLYYLSRILKSGPSSLPASAELKDLTEKGRRLMAMSDKQLDEIIEKEAALLRDREKANEKDLFLSPLSVLLIVLFSLLVFIKAYQQIDNNLRSITKTNNQLMINYAVFEHSEQIAYISHWHWNIKENNLSFSNNLYNMLGCEPKEFDASVENLLKYVIPDDHHLFEDEFGTLIKDSLPPDIHFRVKKKDGELRYFKSTGKVINDNDGTEFSIGIIADITEQHNSDNLINEKIADLESSNKQLSAFNHIASHDLREPLRKIRIYISRLRGENPVDFTEKTRTYLSGVDKAANQMQKFIEDLLAYSRANKSSGDFVVSDLNQLLDSTLQDLSQKIEDKNASFKILSPLPVLNVVPFQIKQLFNNLISNSIKYSKSTVAPEITISSSTSGNPDYQGSASSDTTFFKISFSDNGIGFDQHYSENIFTLFFRLHNESEYSGTGIGLAICKIIVENHGGYIFAEGKPGSGATFNIFLPAGMSANHRV